MAQYQHDEWHDKCDRDSIRQGQIAQGQKHQANAYDVKDRTQRCQHCCATTEPQSTAGQPDNRSENNELNEKSCRHQLADPYAAAEQFRDGISKRSKDAKP